jgi:hypothetical protein
LQKKRFKTSVIQRENVNAYILLTLSIISFIYVFYKFEFNIFHLLIRGYEGDDSMSFMTNEMSQSSYLILTKFIRPMPASCLLLFKTANKKNIIVEFILWIALLLSNSPLGMARFAVAAFYIPICFIYFRFVKKKYNFSLFLIFAVIIIFPFFNQFRQWNDTIAFNFDSKVFATGHFDSFQMFMRVIKENIITYGRQLIGVLLFFVPRSIWIDKPAGSGYFVADTSGLSFDNISMNFFGEGYLNFGLFGILLFVVCVASFNSMMDYKFWEKRTTSLFRSIFYLLMGMEFVILRGQLLSFFPITVGYILSTYFIYKCASSKILNKI